MFHYNRAANLEFTCANLRRYAGMGIEISVMDMSDSRASVWSLVEKKLVDTLFCQKRVLSDPNDLHTYFLEWVPQRFDGNVGVLGLDVVPRTEDWAIKAQGLFQRYEFFAGHGEDNLYFAGPERSSYAHPDCVFYSTEFVRSNSLVWRPHCPVTSVSLDLWLRLQYYDTGEYATKQLRSTGTEVTFHPLLFHAGGCTYQDQAKTIMALSEQMREFGLEPVD